jgi:putative transposase
MHIKKRGGGIADYRSRGLNVSRILALLKFPESTHYYSLSSLHLIRGRKASMITERITDSGIVEITDEQLLLDIMDLLGREFVCYGYKKACKYLQRSGHIINRKKVFRIMEENNLLNYRYNYRNPPRMVVESTIHVMKPNEVWEMDIKYVYIQGENRTAYLFAVTDCYTREVVGKYIGYHCSSLNVKMAIDFATY